VKSRKMKFREILKSGAKPFSLIALTLILPFIISSFIIPVIIYYEEWMLNASITQWLLIYGILTIAMAFACIHTTSVSIISGYFLGWISFPFLLLSYAGALFIGFLIGRSVDKGELIKKLLEFKGANEVQKDLKKNETMVIFLSRISPILPFAMMNLLLSVLNANFKKYMAAGIAGMIPRSALFLFIGLQARTVREALANALGNVHSRIFVLILLIISVLGLFYYILHAIRQKRRN
jgi:uncharacterized membrane protein YdjX (TVP38/TMEM64 family)